MSEENANGLRQSALQAGEEPIPELPENATPEEKDLHWFKHVYQGDRMRQLTFRAVFMGGILGMFMSISNLYTTVKLGWAFGVAITACVLSFVIWNGIRLAWNGLFPRKLSMMTILENNCMQSTASAAGYSTGGTIGTAFGAWLLIHGEHVNAWTLTPFVFLVAALGVFIAIPMKRNMINHEQLKFPSGIAAAETLRSLYSEGKESMQKAWSLLIALGVGMFTALIRTYPDVVAVLQEVNKAPEWLSKMVEKHLYVPALFAFPTRWAGMAKYRLDTFGFEPSLLLVAAGMIVGLRVSLSMLAGSVILFFFVGPWIASHDAAEMAANATMYGWEPYVNDPDGYLGLFYPVKWALWGGTSLMVFSSLTAVGIGWKTLVRAFTRFGPGGPTTSAEVEAMSKIEVPTKWFLGGLIPLGLALVVLQYFAFQMNIFLGIHSVVMSFPLALVCCRATGETDTTPVGAMGKITQLVYALVAKGNTLVNLMSAGVTAGAGGSSADLLTDLKSGYVLGANPRKQFLAQFYGCFFGTLIIVPAWYLMFPNKEVLESYHPPAAEMWRAVAVALTEGINVIPETARWAIVIGGLIGIILPLLATLLPKYARYMPSAMGLGLAWVVPFQNSLSFAIGAVVAWLWVILHKRTAEKYTIPIASGVLAGAALLAATIAIACTVIGMIAKMQGWV
jgi:uncharacterized oligopeptide transporter (OPT) family protein